MDKEIKEVKLPSYSPTEEKINVWTHLIGAAFGIVGALAIIIIACINRSVPQIVSMIIYGATIVELYTMSTLYHSAKDYDIRVKRQKGDHLSINLLISGSVTAYLVGGVQTTAAYIVCGLVWALSILSIVLNTIDVKKYKAISMVCYVLTGWAPIFIVKQVFNAIGIGGFSLLLAGGLVYTIGIIFYGIKKKGMHAAWHFFVLGGSLLHYFGILFYVL